MYGVPDRSAFAQSTVPCIAAVGCLGLALLLVAATVVLALIPVYTSNKSVPANPDAFRSKAIVMALEIDAGTTGGRRRRQSSGLSDIVGGRCDDDGKQKVKDKLIGTFKAHKKIRDIVISIIEFGYEAPEIRLQNITYTTPPIVMVITFFIIYEPICFYPCQVDINPIIRSELYNIPLATLVFTGIAIYKNDVFYRSVSTIICIRIAYVSFIYAGLSSDVISNPVVTISPSVTTTTTTTLPTSGSMIG